MVSINNNYIILTLDEWDISDAFQNVSYYLDPKVYVSGGVIQQCEWEDWNTQFESNCTEAAATLLPSEYRANKKLARELRESIRQASGLTALKGYGPKARQDCPKIPVWPITIHLDLRKHRGIPVLQSSLMASHRVPNNLTVSQYQALANSNHIVVAENGPEDLASFPVPWGASHASLANVGAYIREFGMRQGPNTKSCQNPISTRNPPLFQQAKRSGPLAIVDPNTGLVKTLPVVAASAPAADVTSRIIVAPSPVTLKENFQATSSATHIPKKQARGKVVVKDPIGGQKKTLPGVRKRVVPLKTPSPSSSFSSITKHSAASSPNVSTSTNFSSPPPYEGNHCDECLCMEYVSVRTPPPCREKICSPGCLCASVRKCIPYQRDLRRYPLGFSAEVEARDEYKSLVQARCRKVQDQNQRERRRSFDTFDHDYKHILSYERCGYHFMKGKDQYEVLKNVRYKEGRYEDLNSVPNGKSKTELVHFMQQKGYRDAITA